MSTTIKLFYTNRDTSAKWELLPNKLLIVEDIESYLTSKAALTINNFQYIKNDLEIGINVQMSQSFSQPKSALNFKYVAITNDTELTHYYFVKKAVWRSKDCVRFELIMDVLNTFQENRDYIFKANTRIIREHKNRFIKQPSNILELYITNVISSSGTFKEGYLIDIYDINNNLVCSGNITQLLSNGLRIDITNPSSHEAVINAFDNSITAPFRMVYGEDAYLVFLTAQGLYRFTGFELWRNIDFQSEGINPLLVRRYSSVINDSASLLNQNWYLLYRNQDNPSDSLVNPVECYLIPENDTNTNAAYISNGRLVPSWLEEGKWYWFQVNSSGQSITLSNGISVSNIPYAKFLITRAGNKINISHYRINSNDEGYLAWQFDDIEYITFTGLPIKYKVYTLCPIVNRSFIMTLLGNGANNFDNNTTYNKLDNISYLDRTDAKNIKLIKLPYCPSNFIISNNILQIAGSTTWDYSSITQASGGIFHALRLINLNTKLQRNFSKSSAVINPFYKLKVRNTFPNYTDLRKPLSDELESKLFHSDFYSPTFVYDSFALKIDLEKCEVSNYIDSGVENLNIKFTMTSTINSKFLFTFANYYCNQSTENFYNVIPVGRNNEIVLYNVPYINYIRTGFNYDVKAKNIANTSNYIGLGLSMASVGASLLAPSVPLKIAGVVASLVSVAMSIKNTIVSAVNNENSIKQKIISTQNQATSVAGSDDVDLMSEYCGNRLQHYLYKPTEMMTNLLNDLFFYAGYSSNRMAIPTHNNRVNFDYLECEASIEAAASIPDECMTELVNCFKTGVVYLHKVDSRSTKWDFEQKYENWEKDLFEE